MIKCNILGVEVDVTNIETTLEYIEKNLENLKGNYICVSNVHTTVMAYDNDYYKNIQNSSAMTLPDGKPLSLISKRKGFTKAERVTGPEVMERIFELSQEKGYSHFFYGSTQQTLDKIKENLNLKYPNLKIVGMISPPFKKINYIKDKEYIDIINSSKADFLWVGLGAPKQEIWMYEHKNKVRSIMIGVGAGFDYYAENIKRAPIWMQKCSLEWLYRCMQEPKRLFWRYLSTNTKFIYYNLIGK